MDFGSRIKQLRIKKNITQQDLADLLGVGRPTVAGYETKNKQPDYDKLVKIASFFNVTVDYLLGLTDNFTPIKKNNTIPILGIIRAGHPILAQENWDEIIHVPVELSVDFALKIKGDSMSWVGIHEGDIALIRKCNAPIPGMIVAAGVEEMEWEVTLKFYFEENNEKFLRAANPAYKDIKLTNKHQIVGQLIKVIKSSPPFQYFRDIIYQKCLFDEEWTRVIEKATNLGIHGKDFEKIIQVLAQLKNESI